MTVKRGWQALRQIMKAVKQLAKDKRLPWWLRGLLLVGLVQIPVLPIDEIALVAAIAIIAIWYRQPLADALTTARGK